MCVFYVDNENGANVKATVYSEESNILQIIDKDRREGGDGKEKDFNDVMVD